MNDRVKQASLVLLALMILTICIFPTMHVRTPLLYAQGDSPLPTETATWTPTPTIISTPTETSTPTFTPTGTITPSPTPTPTKGIIVEIDRPHSGDAIAGFVKIWGTALIQDYRKYDLHISPAGNESWSWVTTGFKFIRDGQLHLLDTSKYPDGFYDLRLRAIAADGNYNQAYVRNVEIRNANPPTSTPAYNAAGTLIPRSPLRTPTATPDIRVRIPGAQGFYGPSEHTVIYGYEPIIATVNNLGKNFFERYELSISVAGLEEWSHLITSRVQYWQSPIYVLDTTQYRDGFYDLRLRVVYEDGNYSEYHLRGLKIANGQNRAKIDRSLAVTNGIHKPYQGAEVGGIVHFIGTAVDPNFRRWELYWSPSGENRWAFLIDDDRPIIRGLLARLDLSLLPYGPYDFLLRVVRQDANYDEFIVRDVWIIPPTPTNTPTPTLTPTS